MRPGGGGEGACRERGESAGRTGCRSGRPGRAAARPRAPCHRKGGRGKAGGRGRGPGHRSAFQSSKSSSMALSASPSPPSPHCGGREGEGERRSCTDGDGRAKHSQNTQGSQEPMPASLIPAKTLKAFPRNVLGIRRDSCVRKHRTLAFKKRRFASRHPPPTPPPPRRAALKP